MNNNSIRNNKIFLKSKKKTRQKNRSRYISIIKIIAYLIIGVLIFISNFAMHLFSFQIIGEPYKSNVGNIEKGTETKTDGNYMDHLKNIDIELNTIIKNICIQSGFTDLEQNLKVINNDFSLTQQEFIFKTSLNKIGLSLNMEVQIQDTLYNKSISKINLNNINLLEFSIIDMITNPEAEFDKIIKTLQSMYTNIIKQIFCKYISQQLHFIGLEPEKMFSETFMEAYGCNNSDITKPTKSFLDTLNNNNEKSIHIIEKKKIFLEAGIKKMMTCIESDLKNIIESKKNESIESCETFESISLNDLDQQIPLTDDGKKAFAKKISLTDGEKKALAKKIPLTDGEKKLVESIVNKNKDITPNEDQLTEKNFIEILDIENDELEALLEIQDKKSEKFQEFIKTQQKFKQTEFKNILSILTQIDTIQKSICDNAGINTLKTAIGNFSYDNMLEKINTLKKNKVCKSIMNMEEKNIKQFKYTFIGLYCVYGVFMLISFLYLLFPKQNIGVKLLLGTVLYFPYLIISFIFLIYNLAISSVLVYYNKKDLFEDKYGSKLKSILNNNNSIVIQNLIFNIEPGGYLFVTASVLFLLLKMYLFLRIFY